MERVKGIEPSQPAWKAGALPLSYTRAKIFYIILNYVISNGIFKIPFNILVVESGFEPLKAKLTDLQSVPFGQLGYSTKKNGAGGRT